MKYLKYLLTVSLFLIVAYINAQHIFIGEEESSRKLKWSDFRGPVNRASSHHAVTAWSMGYEMEKVTSVGNEIKIGKMIVTLKMDPERSWHISEKATDELLKHEQGHFDIGILCMREFITVFNQTTFYKKDFNSKLKKIFNDVMTKYHNLGIQYDNETEHSNNTQAQEMWNAFFAKYI